MTFDPDMVGSFNNEQAQPQEPFSAETPSIGDAPPQVEQPTTEDFLREDPLDSPEVSELKKNLTAGFHRQLNKLKEREAALNVDPSRLDELSKKASAFDNLLKNPQAVEALKVLQQNPQPQAQVVPFDSGQIVSRLPKAISEKFETEHLNPLVDLTWQVIENGLLPLLRPYQQMLEQQIMTNYNTERDTLVKEYSADQRMMASAEQLAAQKGLTLRQAMLLVTNGAPQQKQQPQHNSNQGQYLPRSVPPQQVSKTAPNGYTDDDIARELFDMDQGTSKRYSLNFMRRG